jgi:hypothetical protein
MMIGDTLINSSASVKNLGSIWDQSMNMEEHISHICKACYYHLRNISAIRDSLTRSATEKLIHALITSRLDNGNALLCNLPKNLIAKLQRVLNTAARIVTRSSKHSSISAVLKELHWLPIAARIKFKICIMTWKILNNAAPPYLKELIVPYTPSRSLRSNDSLLLSVPRSRVAYGDRAFTVAAPKLWNCLPLPLRQITCCSAFKKALKTHLFKDSYEL